MRQLVYVIATLLILGSCKQETAKTGTTLNIVTTTGMIGDAVKNIVGEKANVTTLMGPGVDPHLYKATQGDLNALRAADIVFYNSAKPE